MKKLSLFLGLLLLINVTKTFADEGMWLLMLLKDQNIEEMKKKGFKLTAEQIYNVNASCMKDAIVGLGNAESPFFHFCTGEIVSPEGLFFTNYHCGHEKIQSHTSIEHDYLTNGFWANNKDQELANEGMTVSILIRMEDVTDQVLKALNPEMSEEKRAEAIEKISKKIENKATDGTKYKAQMFSTTISSFCLFILFMKMFVW